MVLCQTWFLSNAITNQKSFINHHSKIKKNKDSQLLPTKRIDSTLKKPNMYKNSSIERRKGSPIAINKQLIRQDERKIGKKPTF